MQDKIFTPGRAILKTHHRKYIHCKENVCICTWFLPTRTIEIIALGLNCPSILNLNWSLKMMARRRTTTNRIVSIRLTSHGTSRNLFSAETPKMCKNLYLIDCNSRYECFLQHLLILFMRLILNILKLNLLIMIIIIIIIIIITFCYSPILTWLIVIQ